MDSIGSQAVARTPGLDRKACTPTMSPQKWRITLNGWAQKALMWEYGVSQRGEPAPPYFFSLPLKPTLWTQ